MLRAPYTLADLPGKIGSQINVTAIREELKQLVIVTPDYAKQKIVISVLLIDKDNLTNYNNEVKIVIDSAVHNDLFSNYVKGLPEPHSRGVYDFDNIILELDMKKEEDLLVKMLKARLKKKLYQGMRLYSKSRDINNELQLLLKAKGIEIEYNGEAKKRLILVIKEFLESKKAVIKPADQQIYDHCLLFATLLSNKHKGRSIKDKEKSFLTEFQIKFPKLPESSTTKYNMKYYDRKTGIISDKEQRSILLGNLYAFIIYLNEHS